MHQVPDDLHILIHVAPNQLEITTYELNSLPVFSKFSFNKNIMEFLIMIDLILY